MEGSVLEPTLIHTSTRKDPGLPTSHLAHPLVYPLPSWEVGVEI